MSGAEFRRRAHELVDLIAAYWEQVDALPVQSRSRPGDLLSALPLAAPDHAMGEAGWNGLAAEIDRLIMPGLTHWQSGNFFGYFPANISGPAVLGELLAAGLGVQGMLWSTSPACTELEMRVLDWLGRAIGLPEAFLFGAAGHGASGGGSIQGTASDAAVSVLVAARARQRGTGQQGPGVVYTSSQAHSSIVKAAMVTGVAAGPDDRTHARLIDVDAQGAMRPEALRIALREDLAAGRVPLLVAATIGTTGTTAIDPLAEIGAALGEIDAARRPWLHVDAAHAGAACVCPEFQVWLAGIERADSICFNPHKWLLTNFDCDCLWVRERRWLVQGMSITPEYLRNAGTDAGVVDYRDWHVPLGRRFRSLKLWLVLRHYGLEGLRAYIRGHMELAREFEEAMRLQPDFEVWGTRTMNLVCVHARPLPGEAPAATDARTKRVMERVNASGRAFVTHTVTPGGDGGPRRLVIRVAIGAARTTRAHVMALVDLLREAARGVE